MGIRGRTRRLEGRLGLGTDKACPKCSGRILYAEHHEDGAIGYPLGEPCTACSNKPWGGRVGVIEVMAPGSEDAN